MPLPRAAAAGIGSAGAAGSAGAGSAGLAALGPLLGAAAIGAAIGGTAGYLRYTGQTPLDLILANLPRADLSLTNPNGISPAGEFEFASSETYRFAATLQTQRADGSWQDNLSGDSYVYGPVTVSNSTAGGGGFLRVTHYGSFLNGNPRSSTPQTSENPGTIFGAGNPLPPNWRYFPVTVTPITLAGQPLADPVFIGAPGAVPTSPGSLARPGYAPPAPNAPPPANPGQERQTSPQPGIGNPAQNPLSPPLLPFLPPNPFNPNSPGGGTPGRPGAPGRPGVRPPIPGRPVQQPPNRGFGNNWGVSRSFEFQTQGGRQPGTNVQPCRNRNTSPCQGRIGDLAEENNQLLRQLQQNNAGQNLDNLANAEILRRLAIIDAKLGPQLPGGGIANFLKGLWDSLGLQKILNLLTFVTVLHNAYWMSNSVTQTLFGAFDNVLRIFGGQLKNAEGENIDTSEWVGDKVEDFFNGIFGTETVDGIKEGWAKFSRIYQAASNIWWGMQSMLYSVQEALETVGNYVALIGNAARKYGVFIEKAYGWMNPNLNFRHNRFFRGLEVAEDAASALENVTGEVLNVTETWTEIQKDTIRLREELSGIRINSPPESPRSASVTNTPENTPVLQFESELTEASIDVIQPIPPEAEQNQVSEDE